jgi:hypothetical protein
MKKLTLALATIGLTTSLSVFASAPTGAQPFQVMVPDIKSGFDFTLTGLYLKPTASNNQLFYAETEKNNVDTNYSNEPGDHPAFSLGMGYVFKNSGNDVRLNWTHLHSSDDSSTTGNIVNPNFSAPLIANSTVKFKYDAVDFDFGQYLSLGTRMQTRWFAGVRFAQINQDQTTSYAPKPTDLAPSGSIADNSKFSGIGPRLGVDGNYYLGKGFGFVTQLAGSLLVGNTESNTTWLTENPSTVDNPSQSRVVPALDGKLGVDYSKAMRNGSHFAIEAGYQISEYFNAIDRNTTAWSSDGSNTFTSSNIGFQGPYLSVKYKV